ncbi:hypothetical protein SELMODRAFT_451362 [Selaginella moellendorffii]|uniref:Uncharacterized protein HANb-1 n=2 Tax=Selaginella moellendorffii TaxID=88036 RepID=D8R4U4_SELML|nr:hypothetical protein SELMODRAFT_107936 [Selaginella moellendorffii]EFJ32731.1 hypothetical protein SELMODRAFT_451362 [Selaginella moellendorffii]
MDEDNDSKVEIAKLGERSDEEWIKPKLERKSELLDGKSLCGRLAVITSHSPPRNHASDGAASSSEMSPGATSPSRSCTQCGATKTPLWRNGPCGPKSLCNACGIRYKKVGSTKRTSNSSDPHEQPQKLSTKSPKRKAEAVEETERSHGHRRSRLVVRGEKREAVEEKASCSSSQVVFKQQCSSRQAPVPRRVCTRRSLPSGFHTPKWGSRSARFNTFRKSHQTKDEEEGAALLMALACGLVNA